MQKIDEGMLIRLIGNEHNHQMDYSFIIKLIERRNKQIDLENSIVSGNSSFSSSAARDFLKELRDMEINACDATAYSVYYNELARGYELIGDFIESYVCAFNAYCANVFCGDENGAYLSCILMSEYAYALKDLATSAKWLDERDKHVPEHEFDELEYEAKVRDIDKSVVPLKELVDAEFVKDALKPLISNDVQILYRAVAARRIRRNTKIPFKKAQKMIEYIDLEPLGAAIGEYPYMPVDQRFFGEAHDQNTDNLLFEGEDWMPTERESGYFDRKGKTINDGSVIVVKNLGMFRVAFHMEKWYCLSGIIAMLFDDEVMNEEVYIVDDIDTLRNVITKTEWLHDNGARL